MTYQPYKGVMPDGTEVLVSVYTKDFGGGAYEEVSSVEVAFREKPHHTWGPPVQLERAS